MQMLKEISNYNPYYKLSYLPGSEYALMSVKDYDSFDYSVQHKAEAQEKLKKFLMKE